MNLEPVTAEEADLTPTSGTVTIVDGVGSFTVSAVEDYLTEGDETFRALLRTGSIAGEIVAVSEIVTITDTSLG